MHVVAYIPIQLFHVRKFCAQIGENRSKTAASIAETILQIWTDGILDSGELKIN